jgi:hypothetical protein
VANRGRPRRKDRDIFNAILWVNRPARSGASCLDFPPQQTCYGRYTVWKKSGLLAQGIALLEVIDREISALLSKSEK